MQSASLVPMKDIRGYLTEDQVIMLINNADSLRDELLIRLMYYCARRVSEVLKITPHNIIANERIIIFPLEKKKGKVLLRVPVNQETLKKLLYYIKIKKIGPKTRIFKIKRVQVYNIIRRIGKKCGIEKVGEKWIHPHVLRHSFCINWVKKGGSSQEEMRKLQMILGHANIATTMFYLQFSPIEVRSSYDKYIK